MADIALGGLDAASAAANVGERGSTAGHLGTADDDADVFHDAAEHPQDPQGSDVGLTTTDQQAAGPSTSTGTQGQAAPDAPSGSSTAGATGGTGQVVPTAHQPLAGDGAAPNVSATHQPAAGGGDGTVPAVRTNPEIDRYQAVADWYEDALRPAADQQPAEATGFWNRLTANRRNTSDQQTAPAGDRQPSHPSLALRQGNLADAIRDMRSAINEQGAVRDPTAYTAARDRADTNAAELVNTRTSENALEHDRRQEAATLRVASRTTAGIWAGSAIAGVSTIGAAVTGGLVAWNNVRQGHHLSSGGGTTNQTNNGTNTITNNAPTNETNNGTNGTGTQT